MSWVCWSGWSGHNSHPQEDMDVCLLFPCCNNLGSTIVDVTGVIKALYPTAVPASLTNPPGISWHSRGGLRLIPAKKLNPVPTIAKKRSQQRLQRHESATVYLSICYCWGDKMSRWRIHPCLPLPSWASSFCFDTSLSAHWIAKCWPRLDGDKSNKDPPQCRILPRWGK